MVKGIVVMRIVLEKSFLSIEQLEETWGVAGRKLEERGMKNHLESQDLHLSLNDIMSYIILSDLTNTYCHCAKNVQSNFHSMAIQCNRISRKKWFIDIVMSN